MEQSCSYTYSWYTDMINTIKSERYRFVDYHNWKQYSRCIILRHDIDYDIQKAVQIARIERACGVQSTFFVLITSDFYNVFSQASRIALQEIVDCGHEIGLHFDEARYPDLEINEIKEKIINECELLGKAITRRITTVSMHRPSKAILEADLQIPGTINSYGYEYFHSFKYISDSRRRWREFPENIIKSGKFNRLHLLIHAFWYNEEELSLHDSLLSFINDGSVSRYKIMNNNFTNLSDEVSVEEVFGGRA